MIEATGRPYVSASTDTDRAAHGRATQTVSRTNGDETGHPPGIRSAGIDWSCPLYDRVGSPWPDEQGRCRGNGSRILASPLGQSASLRVRVR